MLGQPVSEERSTLIEKMIGEHPLLALYLVVPAALE